MSDWEKDTGLGRLESCLACPKLCDVEPTNLSTYSPAGMAGLGTVSPTLMIPSHHGDSILTLLTPSPHPADP